MKHYSNPLSPGLHTIPAHCSICGKPQWDGKEALSGMIEDYEISPGVWTVVHEACIPARPSREDLEFGGEG